MMHDANSIQQLMQFSVFLDDEAKQRLRNGGNLKYDGVLMRLCEGNVLILTFILLILLIKIL